MNFSVPEAAFRVHEKLFVDAQLGPAQVQLLIQKNRDLETELARLKEEITKLKNDEINPKTKKSLQIMVLAMALEQYGWDPLAMRNDAAKNIASDAHTQGLAITDQTVRNQLFAAMEQKKAGYLPESQA